MYLLLYTFHPYLYNKFSFSGIKEKKKLSYLCTPQPFPVGTYFSQLSSPHSPFLKLYLPQNNSPPHPDTLPKVLQIPKRNISARKDLTPVHSLDPRVTVLEN